MKKALLIWILLFGFALLTPVMAQRHVKHISAWGAHYGRTENGEFYEGSYLNYLTDKISVRVSGLREFGNVEGEREYSAFSSRVFLSPQFFRIGEFAYFHLLLGGMGSYESTKGVSVPRESNSAKRERIIYGPQAGLEVDIFLHNRISLVASGTKGKMFNHSHLDEWPGHAGFGIRYHFR
ncbi:hypothetical protein [Adhaeribacter aquaticus]|uniref:hypothetical protein n=1 Tax=Adhaeribacter aquaticus TaxID=299567 RepID=UPI000415C7AD|nr:hypothetical protein [Adhaeribacter aquaticus]